MPTTFGEIYFAVLLHAKTKALISVTEDSVNQYDFSVDDSNSLYHVIDADILQKCLLYASTGATTEFKLDHQYTDELANAINLINRIGSLELDVNDPEHNSLQRDNPLNPSTPSYPGVSPTSTIITPDRSTLALQFVSYLATLAFYNPQAHGPFSNIFTMSKDFIQGIQTDSNNYTTLGAQLVEQIDPACNNSGILQTIFDQLMAIDPDRFNTSDDLDNDNDTHFKPFPFRNGDYLKFDIVINSIISTPTNSEPIPSNSYNFRHLTVANLFKNNKNLISTPALNGAAAIVNEAYVDSLSNNELIMKPKIFRVKLLLQSRQSVVNLPSVAATYYLYNASMPSIEETFTDYTFTGSGLNLNDTQEHFKKMVHIITCPETLIGNSLATQSMFDGLNLNVDNIQHLSQLFNLVKLSNTWLIDMLSNLDNLSNEDLSPSLNTTDLDLSKYTLLVDNITYIQQVLLLLLSLSNSGNSPEVFKQKELMLVKLASNIISNVSDEILQYFSLFDVLPNTDTSTLHSFVNNEATSVDILPVGDDALVLYLDCLKQLSDYTKSIQSISTTPTSTRFIGDTSIGFCEPIQLESLIKKFVSDMNPESPPVSSTYTDHLKQYCKLVQDVLLVSNFILKGGSFNPSIFINSMVDKTNSAYSSIMLNYGLVVTNIGQTKDAKLTSIVVSETGEFKNLIYTDLFDLSGQPPSVDQIATSISTAFTSDASASALTPASYTDLSNLSVNGVTML
jgi:hypothetical protein